MRILHNGGLLKHTAAARKARFGYLFILPFVLGLAVIFIPNIVQTFLYSISEIDPSAGFALNPKGFVFYRDALTVDPKFTRMLLTDLAGLLADVPVILIYSLFIATLLNQKFAGRGLARIIFFYPVIMATGFMNAVDSEQYMSLLGGAVDTGASADLSNMAEITGILSSLYFPEALVQLISDAIERIYDITSCSGLQIFIFLAGLQNISPSLYEAAEIEGCSKWELFWKITFPMISPILVMNLVYSIADRAMDGEAFDYINTLAFGQSQYSLASAMNMLYLFCLGVMIVLILLLVRRFRVQPE